MKRRGGRVEGGEKGRKRSNVSSAAGETGTGTELTQAQVVANESLRGTAGASIQPGSDGLRWMASLDE